MDFCGAGSTYGSVALGLSPGLGGGVKLQKPGEQKPALPPPFLTLSRPVPILVLPDPFLTLLFPSSIWHWQRPGAHWQSGREQGSAHKPRTTQAQCHLKDCGQDCWGVGPMGHGK